MTLPLLTETSRSQGLDDLLLATLDTLVSQDEDESGGVGFGTIDIVLDVECVNFVRGGETFNLAVGDGTHDGRLSDTIPTTETITETTLETGGSGIEQDLGIISKRELAVTKILTLFFVFSITSFAVMLGRGLDSPVVEDGDRVAVSRLLHKERSERSPFRGGGYWS